MDTSDKKALRKLQLANHLDNMLARGFVSLIVALVLVAVIIVVIAGVAYLVLSPGNGMTVGEAFWTAFAFTTNPELPAFDEVSDMASYAIITFVVVIVGLLATSALIGIITTALSTYYEDLQRGFSPVLADDHIAIVGFNDNVQVLIAEFRESHEQHCSQSLVFIDDTLTREEMERRIETYLGMSLQRFKKETGCKVICRNGDLRDIDDLRRCAVDRAKAVIINDYDDSLILKTLLAVSSLLRQAEQEKMPTIVCTFREEQFARAAYHVGNEGNLRVLSLSDTLSNLIAKTCYQPGLSHVLSELYSYEGSEFYIKEAGMFAGEHFDSLADRFIEAIPVGICRPSETEVCGAEIIMNAPKNVTPEEYDRIMTILESDSLVMLSESQSGLNAVSSKPFACEVDTSQDVWNHRPVDSREEKRILVLGYDETFDRTIINLAKYYQKVSAESDVPNCYIKLLYRNKREARVWDARRRFLRSFERYGVKVTEGESSHGTDSASRPIKDIRVASTLVSFQCAGSDCIDLPVLESVFLSSELFDHVIVLSDLKLGREEADTETLLTLLYLRAIAENARNGVYGENALLPFNITSEIQNMENINLAYNEYVSDYIISWKFVASLQMQIAEHRHLYKILRDLLKPSGSEIQLEQASRYIKEDVLDGRCEIDFDRLAKHLRSLPAIEDKRVLLGYFEGETGRHCLCPPRNAEGRRVVKLRRDDMFIVIKTS